MADMSTVEGALSQPVLTFAVRTYDTEATDSKFGDLWKEGRVKQQEVGTKARWDEIQYSRGLAPITGLLSPTPASPVQTYIPQETEMFRVAEQRFIPWTKLFIDRAMGQLKDDGRQVIMDELADMRNEVNKTLELARAKVLQSGGFVANSTNIPNTDFPFTLDYTVATDSKLAAWSTAGTKILSSELPHFQGTMISNTGRAIGRAIINDVTYGYIIGNTEVSSYGTNQALAEIFLRANVSGEKVLDGIPIGEILWTVNAYGYIPSGGSFTKWMPDNRAVFLPEDLSNVLATAEGKQAVPVNTGVIGQPEANFPELDYGLVAYAKWVDEPVGIKLFLSWFGAPLVTFPKAVLYATLT